MTDETRRATVSPPPSSAPSPHVVGLPPEADFMSVAEFFDALRWEPPGADADLMTAEEFIAAL